MEPLPSHLHYFVSYVGTLTHRLTSPIHSPYFFSTENVSSFVDTTGVHTPSSIVGGGRIPIYTIASSMVGVGSTTIPILSGGTQPSTPFTGAYPFEVPSSEIPSISSTLPSATSTSMALMATRSILFQFGSGNAPPSNPSLKFGSMPFPGHTQNINPFQGNQGLVNPYVSAFGVWKFSHLFGQ